MIIFSDPDEVEFCGAAPIFIRGNTGSFPAEKVLKILAKDHQHSVLCKQQPSRVQINASFLVDLKVVALEDLESDDNGSYEHLGTPTETFNLRFEDGLLKSCHKIARNKVDGETHYFLTRKYRRCASSPDLKRTISYCRTPSGEILGNIALVQYNFEGEEHTFPLKPHGNSRKNKEPYQRTKETTKNVLRSNLEQNTPKEAFQKTTRDLGGTMHACSAAQTPRNRKQAYNMKQSTKTCLQQSQSNDVLASLLTMANEERWGDSKHSFIRSIQTFPNPLFLVLSTSTQLQNLYVYCTSELVSSVLTIDPTFNIGKYSVTPVTYQDLLLVSKRTGEHPICIGPMLISQNLTKDVYTDFVYCIQKNCPRLKEELRTFGTDGEKALEQAFTEGFPSAVKLRCMSHFRNNVKEHLKALEVSERNEIIDQIFGYNTGDGVYHEGMVDADSPQMFDTLYESVRGEWEKKCPPFVRWFDKNTSIVKETMLANVRTSGGLGYPPKKFYTHNSESNNHVIKHKEKYQEVSLPKFVQDMKQLRADYDDEFVKAITGRGEYKMKYPHLALTTDQWFKMTVKQRESYVKKLRGMTMADVLQGETSAVQTVAPTGALSASWEILESPLDDVVLSHIWQKAANIVTSPGAVQCAPFLPNKQPVEGCTFLVVSESSTDNFHTVKCGSGISGVVKCSCPGFTSLGICSHAVAVSEKQALLTEYLDFYKRKTSLNITSINMAGKQDPNVGRKKSNPRKRFKGPMPRTDTVVSCQNVFGLSAREQSQAPATQHLMQSVPTSTSTRSSFDNQGAAGTPNVFVYGDTPASNASDRPFSFLAELLNDEPATFTSTGLVTPVCGFNVLQDFGNPTSVNTPSSQPATLTPAGPVTPVGGFNTFGDLNNPVSVTPRLQPATFTRPMTSAVSPPSPLNMPVTANPSTTSARKTKPAMPQPNVRYNVGTIWGNVKKCYGCKHHFLPAQPPDDQFVLVRPEADWYWDKQTNKWRLGRQSNRYYHMFPQCVIRNFPHFSSQQVIIAPDLPQHVKSVLLHRFGLNV